MLHGIRNGWSRGVVVGQFDRNAGFGEHFCDDLRGAGRGEPGVVSDDDAALRILVLQHIAGNRPRDTADVVKGEVVGDEAAPAIGPEFDFLCHEERFRVSGFERSAGHSQNPKT